MSYILDALRRADAERERDPARGIHAQPAAVIRAPARARVPGWAWPAAAALAVAVVAVVSWQRATPPAPAPVSPVAMPARPAAVPVAAAVLPPAPIVVEKVVRVVPATAPAMNLKAPPAAAPTAATPAAPAASVASATDRVYSLAELPLDVRNALPNLAITGGVHSPVPAQRMLIVGGQVMHEGAELAPGLVLEQIRPRGAVLKFRGYRYGVTY